MDMRPDVPKQRNEMSALTSKQIIAIAALVVAVMVAVPVAVGLQNNNTANGNDTPTAVATGVNVSGVLYTVYSDNTATATGCDSSVTALVIPASITYNETSYNVTAIANNAFSSKRTITSVSLSEGLTAIGNNAFKFCRSNASIDKFPSTLVTIGNSAFYGNSLLQKLPDFPDTLTSIGNQAFYSCTVLSGPIVLPSNLKTLGTSVFASTAITAITFSSGISVVPEQACAQCTALKDITFGDSITSIDNSAFSGCSSVKSIILGNNITAVGNSAFNACTSLENIVLDNKLVSLGSNAFTNDTSLVSIALPDSLTTIGAKAFVNCSELKSIEIGKSMSAISPSIFDGCSKLTSFSVSADNATFESIGSIIYSKDGTSICVVPIGMTGTVSIPDSVTTIAGYAFYKCIGIDTITGGQNVTTIGDHALFGCKGITSVPFNNVTSYGSFAFAGCSSMSSAYICSCSSIPKSMFYNCNNLSSVTVKDGTVVSSIGDFAFAGCVSLTSVPFSDSVETIGSYAFSNCNFTEVDLKAIKTLGEYAFTTCMQMEKLTLPSSLTNMGNGAFSNCYSLTSISMNGVTTISGSAFSGCKALSSITLPDSLTTINDGAFMGCTAITRVTIPKSVTSIGNNVFANCTALSYVDVEAGNANYISESGVVYNIAKTKIMVVPHAFDGSIVIPDTVTEIDGGLFSGSNVKSVTIPKSISSLPFYAFNGCINLENVTISEGITEMRGYAFSGCTALKSVVLPGSLVSIGDGLFSGCTSLTSVTFGNGTTSIGRNMFLNCTSLSSVSMSDTVTSIGSNAFNSCRSLTEINLNKVSTIADSAFKNTALQSIDLSGVSSVSYFLFDGCASLKTVNMETSTADLSMYMFNNCTSLSSVSLPKGISAIPKGAFYGCSSLESMVIPDTVLTIGIKAFYGTGITTLTVGDNVNSIGDDAFAHCSNLTTATLGKSVVAIPADIFYEDAKLTSITINGSITSIGSNAFDGTGLKSFNIPATVTSIGTMFCANTSAVITVDKDNEAFAVEGGALYDKAITKMIECSPATSGAIELPTTVKEIGAHAFDGCSKVTSVKFDGELTTIGKYAFNNCTGIVTMDIPETVTTIGDYAFMGCTSITTAVVPSAITAIPNGLFDNCTSLKTVTVSSNIKSIGSNAFGNCNALTSFDFYNVISIGDRAFEKCVALNTVTIPASVVSIGTSAFLNCDGLQYVVYNTTAINASAFPVSSFYSLQGGEVSLAAFADAGSDIGYYYDSGDVRYFVLGSGFSLTAVEGGYAIVLDVQHNRMTPTVTIDGTVATLGTQSVGGVDCSTFQIPSTTSKTVFINISTDVNTYKLTSTETTPDYTVRVIHGSMEYNTSCAFEIVPNAGYEIGKDGLTVTVNGTELKAYYGARYVFTIDKDSTVTVDGIVASSYTVSYVVGTTTTSETVAYNGTLVSVPTVDAKNGYAFVGWYTDQDLIHQFDAASKITSDLTLYAGWADVSRVTVTYSMVHGIMTASVNDTAISSGDKVPSGCTVVFTATTYYGYRVDQWTIGSETYDVRAVSYSVENVTADLVVKADTEYYTIEFGGTWSGYMYNEVSKDSLLPTDDWQIYWYLGYTGTDMTKDVAVFESTYAGGDILVLDDHLYFAIGSVLYKVDIYDGTVLGTAKLSVTGSPSPTTDNGYIIIGGGVYDQDLNYVCAESDYTKTDSVQHCNTSGGVAYSDDGVYRFKYSGGVFYSYLAANNTYLDSITATKIAQQSTDDTWLTYCEGRVYITTYTSGLFGGATKNTGYITSVDVLDNGKFDKNTLTYTSTGTCMICTGFMAFHGRGYINAGSDFYVYDTATMTVIYKCASTFTHGGLVLNTGYATADNGYTVYLYIIPYENSGSIYVFTDKQGQTEANMTVMSGMGLKQFAMESMNFGANGELIWHNDSYVRFIVGKTITEKTYYFLVENGSTATWMSSTGATPQEALLKISGMSLSEVSGAVSYNGTAMTSGYMANVNYVGWASEGWNAASMTDASLANHRYWIVTSDTAIVKDRTYYLVDDGKATAYGCSDLSHIDALLNKTMVSGLETVATASGNSLTVTVSFETDAADTAVYYLDMDVKFGNSTYTEAALRMNVTDGIASCTFVFGGTAAPSSYVVSVYDAMPTYGSGANMLRTTGNVAM
jgi:uncharacterized repeat protein (TIGR02543 family)